MLCGWKPLSNGTLMLVFGSTCAWDWRAFGVCQMQACSWKDLRPVLAKHCYMASSWELACVSPALDAGRTSSDLPARSHTDRFGMFATKTVIKKWYLELTSVVTTARDLIHVHLKTSHLNDECFPLASFAFFSHCPVTGIPVLFAPFAVISKLFSGVLSKQLNSDESFISHKSIPFYIFLFVRHLISNIFKSLPIPGMYKMEN